MFQKVLKEYRKKTHFFEGIRGLDLYNTEENRRKKRNKLECDEMLVLQKDNPEIYLTYLNYQKIQNDNIEANWKIPSIKFSYLIKLYFELCEDKDRLKTELNTFIGEFICISFSRKKITSWIKGKKNEIEQLLEKNKEYLEGDINIEEIKSMIVDIIHDQRKFAEITDKYKDIKSDISNETRWANNRIYGDAKKVLHKLYTNNSANPELTNTVMKCLFSNNGSIESFMKTHSDWDQYNLKNEFFWCMISHYYETVKKDNTLALKNAEYGMKLIPSSLQLHAFYIRKNSDLFFRLLKVCTKKMEQYNTSNVNEIEQNMHKEEHTIPIDELNQIIEEKGTKFIEMLLSIIEQFRKREEYIRIFTILILCLNVINRATSCTLLKNTNMKEKFEKVEHKIYEYLKLYQTKEPSFFFYLMIQQCVKQVNSEFWKDAEFQKITRTYYIQEQQSGEKQESMNESLDRFFKREEVENIIRDIAKRSENNPYFVYLLTEFLITIFNSKNKNGKEQEEAFVEMHGIGNYSKEEECIEKPNYEYLNKEYNEYFKIQFEGDCDDISENAETYKKKQNNKIPELEIFKIFRRNNLLCDTYNFSTLNVKVMNQLNGISSAFLQNVNFFVHVCLFEKRKDSIIPASNFIYKNTVIERNIHIMKSILYFYLFDRNTLLYEKDLQNEWQLKKEEKEYINKTVQTKNISQKFKNLKKRKTEDSKCGKKQNLKRTQKKTCGKSFHDWYESDSSNVSIDSEKTVKQNNGENNEKETKRRKVQKTKKTDTTVINHMYTNEKEKEKKSSESKQMHTSDIHREEEKKTYLLDILLKEYENNNCHPIVASRIEVAIKTLTSYINNHNITIYVNQKMEKLKTKKSVHE